MSANPTYPVNLRRHAGRHRSVLNVEGVAERLVELDPAVEVEMTYGF